MSNGLDRGDRMAEIKINDNGPLMVKGEDVQLLDGEGNELETKKAYALCRCGLSDNKPFCDGSHTKGFDSSVRA